LSTDCPYPTRPVLVGAAAGFASSAPHCQYPFPFADDPDPKSRPGAYGASARSRGHKDSAFRLRTSSIPRPGRSTTSCGPASVDVLQIAVSSTNSSSTSLSASSSLLPPCPGCHAWSRILERDTVSGKDRSCQVVEVLGQVPGKGDRDHDTTPRRTDKRGRTNRSAAVVPGPLCITNFPGAHEFPRWTLCRRTTRRGRFWRGRRSAPVISGPGRPRCGSGAQGLDVLLRAAQRTRVGRAAGTRVPGRSKMTRPRTRRDRVRVRVQAAAPEVRGVVGWLSTARGSARRS